MHTDVYDLTDDAVYDAAILAAAEAVKASGTVVFPTETVYGIGANAFDESAIKKIFTAKNRPLDNPLIVHLSSPADIFSVVCEIPPNAQTAARAFMPGPITLVLPRGADIPLSVTAGLDTVAVRVPLRQSARDFIKACGVPIVAPSANVSGRPSATSPKHVLDDLYGKVNVILTEGDCEVGLESTVVDFTAGRPKILRPGGVTPEELAKVIDIDENYRPKTGTDDTAVPKSPGMKYRHYKPNAHVICLLGDEKKIVDYINARIKTSGKKCAAAVFEHLTDQVSCSAVFSLGDAKNPREAANKLFYCLRKSDEINADVLFIMSPGTDGIGLAYQNRLRKAADELHEFN